MTKVVMTVRCPNGHLGQIDPTLIAADDFPMCQICLLPALPVKVTTKRRTL